MADLIYNEECYPTPFVLDIGGEGRHLNAWNLNPRTMKTIGPHRGQPIPRLIQGRAENIPLPNGSVDEVIVERTPLLAAAYGEILRVAKSGAVIILRHAPIPRFDPHCLAHRLLMGKKSCSTTQIGSQMLQQTTIQLDETSDSFTGDFRSR